MSTAEILRRAAEAYRSGEIQWGRNFYVDESTGCRCALGALAYTRTHTTFLMSFRYEAGDEVWQAANVLAEYLVDCGATPALDEDRRLDRIETIGAWNDEQESVEPVIAALEEAAEVTA